jgi:hypothetical protein
MNDDERLNLRKMIAANNTEDNTSKIRNLKHGELIRADVATLLKVKHDYARLEKSNPAQFDAICVSRCAFLFKHYTDIFNKIKKNEMDLTILMKFVSVLKLIEDGKIDQHDGSFEVGKLLKQIYIDSAIRTSEHLDEKYAAIEKRSSAAGSAGGIEAECDPDSVRTPVSGANKIKNVSWKQFKRSQSTRSQPLQPTQPTQQPTQSQEE